MATSLAERIQSKVEPVPIGGCHVWMGQTNDSGYGMIRDGVRRIRVHRAVYELHNGPVKDGDCVCHRCDNPLCVNPHHLFVGSRADNNADKTRKGRQARGHKHSLALRGRTWRL